MSQYEFAPDANQKLTPKAWYEAALQKNGFIHDPVQAEAVELLQALFVKLLDFQKKRNRFLGRSLRNPHIPRGLYLWGGVGRGKSFLMDTFYSCVPYKRKKRTHFHPFMMDIHQRLRAAEHAADPLLEVARQIASETRLLCFDEFHVSDIADAMILGRLLKELMARGVIFVMTSNYAPENLYPDGLHRESFLPAIALIQSELDVFNLDGGQDYRHRLLSKEPLYLTPLAGTEDKLAAMFARLHADQELPSQIEILGREIRCVRHASGIVWFDFAQICDGPRAQTDYLEIAKRYHTVFVSNIPKLRAQDSAQARRLTWLVDVFYDARVKLIVSAEVDIDALYTEGIQASEFFRTASRLNEMQSSEYLALEHQYSVQQDESH